MDVPVTSRVTTSASASVDVPVTSRVTTSASARVDVPVTSRVTTSASAKVAVPVTSSTATSASAKVAVPVTVMLLYVDVPVNDGLDVGAASDSAVCMEINSVVKSAPTITLSGSFEGSASLAPKLVVGMYVMLISFSDRILLYALCGQRTDRRKRPRRAASCYLD